MSGSLIAPLQELSPAIEEKIKVSGTPGVTVGILHHGQPIHTKGFGFCNVPKRLVSDENTIYYLASLSKTFTAAMVAMLVERGRLEWTTPISELLPDFQHWDPLLQENASITDFPSHRSGLASKNHLWSQEFGQSTLRLRDGIPTVNALDKLFDLGQGFQYNNWGYVVAEENGKLVEKEKVS